MIFYMITDIDSETVKAFIIFLNENPPEKTNKFQIYLCSNGGDPEQGRAIIYLINKHKDRITIKAYGSICSTAFEMYVLAKCKKRILKHTTGMYHRAARQVSMLGFSLGKTEDDNAALEWLEADNKITKKVCELVNMSEITKADIQKGRDFYFTYEEMIAMLK